MRLKQNSKMDRSVIRHGILVTVKNNIACVFIISQDASPDYFNYSINNNTNPSNETVVQLFMQVVYVIALQWQSQLMAPCSLNIDFTVG